MPFPSTTMLGGIKASLLNEGVMDIKREEFEQKRPLFEYCRWINEKLQLIDQETNRNEQIFERKGMNYKKLFEESVPISRLGLYLWHEWNELFIQSFTDIPDYDAIIEIVSPRNSKIIKVEVTTTENEESAMRRQSLSRNGIVSFAGPIEREGRDIIFTPEMVNDDEQCVKIIDIARQRLESKLKNKYDDNTAILLYVSNLWKISYFHRFALIKNIQAILKENQPILYGVYICYDMNKGIDGIQNSLVNHYDMF
jgi:hypothetical protein